MLLACGERGERGVPKQIFVAANLDPGLARQTRAVCEKAGVKKGALLDACTLDVAVIGSPNRCDGVHNGAPTARARQRTMTAPKPRRPS